MNPKLGAGIVGAVIGLIIGIFIGRMAGDRYQLMPSGNQTFVWRLDKRTGDTLAIPIRQ